MDRSKKNSGITLTELVIVMVVLSILASVSMPMYRMTVRRTKEATLRRDLRTIRDGIDQYKQLSDDGYIPKQPGDSGFPKTIEDLTRVITLQKPVVQIAGKAQPPERIRILRSIPADPMTGNNEWGLRSNKDDPDSTAWGGDDVFDVYSKSDGTALDGTYYKDW